MNVLISQFFGDPYFKFSCPNGGECIHGNFPGIEKPKGIPCLTIEYSFTIVLTIGTLVVTISIVAKCLKNRKLVGYMSIAAEDIENNKQRMKSRTLYMFNFGIYSIEVRENIPVVERKLEIQD